LTQSPQILVHN